jgi:pimeloyl-ACP methyl ester carboxylesterase
MARLAARPIEDESALRPVDPEAARGAPLAAIFDRSGRVPRPSLGLLLGELKAFLTDPLPGAPAAEGPRGDGHPVLALPPLLCGDRLTRPLRAYLEACGFAPYGWELGRNLGPSPALQAGVLRRLAELHAHHRRKVSLVGISLGGIQAREAARRHPEMVRQVVTLCSPFRLPTASLVAPLLRLILARHAAFLALHLDEVAEPPPLPTTALYSRDDGIVAWQSCLNPETALAENIELVGAHTTIGRNRAALALLVERLAQPEGVWRPYRCNGNGLTA